MFRRWNLFNILLVFFLSYQECQVDGFDQICQPEESRKCMPRNSLRAAFHKRSETPIQQPSIDKNQQSDDDDQLAMQLQMNSAGNDRLGDLLDLNSEPAVEDLMRQIMSQAKLWEAIQEANREMVNQKVNDASKARERFPLTFSAQ